MKSRLLISRFLQVDLASRSDFVETHIVWQRGGSGVLIRVVKEKQLNFGSREMAEKENNIKLLLVTRASLLEAGQGKPIAHDPATRELLHSSPQDRSAR